MQDLVYILNRNKKVHTFFDLNKSKELYCLAILTLQAEMLYGCIKEDNPLSTWVRNVF